MNLMTDIRTSLARFRRDQDGGVSTLEFVIIAPFLFFMFFATFEAGWLMLRQMMLDRGLDMAMREVRLNIVPNITHSELKENICEEAIGIKDCENSLFIEMRSLAEVEANDDATTGRRWPYTTIMCRDKAEEIDPAVDAASFGSNEPDVLMFVVACVVVDPLIPGLGGLVPGMTAINNTLDEARAGGYKMASFAAYKSEPDK